MTAQPGGFPPCRQLVRKVCDRCAGEVERSGDEAGVAEDLWRVAGVTSGDRTVFLAELAAVRCTGTAGGRQLGCVICAAGPA